MKIYMKTQDQCPLHWHNFDIPGSFLIYQVYLSSYVFPFSHEVCNMLDSVPFLKQRYFVQEVQGVLAIECNKTKLFLKQRL